MTTTLSAAPPSLTSLRAELRAASISAVVKELRSNASEEQRILRSVFCDALQNAFTTEGMNEAATSAIDFLFDAVASAAGEEDDGEVRGVSLSAIVAALGSLCASDHVAVTREVFAVFGEDADSNDPTAIEISQSAMKRFLRVVIGTTLGLSDDVSNRPMHRDTAFVAANQIAEAAFTAIDKNGSHTIDRTEFMAWLSTLKGLGGEAETGAGASLRREASEKQNPAHEVWESKDGGEIDSPRHHAPKPPRGPRPPPAPQPAALAAASEENLHSTIEESELQLALREAQHEIALLRDAADANTAESGERMARFKKMAMRLRGEDDVRHDAKVQELNDTILCLKEVADIQLREIEEQNEKEVALLEQQHELASSGRADEYKLAVDALAKMDMDHAETIASHKAELASYMEAHAEALESHEGAHAEALESHASTHAEQTSTLVQEMETARVAHAEALDSHEGGMASQTKAHAQALDSHKEELASHAEAHAQALNSHKEAHAEALEAASDHLEAHTEALEASHAEALELHEAAHAELTETHAAAIEAHVVAIEKEREQQLVALAQVILEHDSTTESITNELSEQLVTEQTLRASDSVRLTEESTLALKTAQDVHEEVHAETIASHKAELASHIEAHTEALESHEKALAEALESHTSTHAEQASALMQEMEAARVAHAEAHAEALDSHTEELASHAEAHSQALNSHAEAHAEALDSHKDAHAEKMETARVAHAGEIEALEASHAAAHAEFTEAHAATIAANAAAIEQERELLAVEIAAAHEAHEVKIAAAIEEHAVKIAAVETARDAASRAQQEVQVKYDAAVAMHAKQVVEVRETARDFIKKTMADAAAKEEKVFSQHRKEMEATRSSSSTAVIKMEEELWKHELAKSAADAESAAAATAKEQAVIAVRTRSSPHACIYIVRKISILILHTSRVFFCIVLSSSFYPCNSGTKVRCAASKSIRTIALSHSRAATTRSWPCSRRMESRLTSR